MGRTLKVTPEVLKQVEKLAAMGLKWDAIGRICDVAAGTLKNNKKSAAAYKLGIDKVNNNVAQTAYQMATSGKHPTMTQFWLKTRAGWRENDGLEITVKGDKEASETIMARLDKLGASLKKKKASAKDK